MEEQLERGVHPWSLENAKSLFVVFAFVVAVVVAVPVAVVVAGGFFVCFGDELRGRVSTCVLFS